MVVLNYNNISQCYCLYCIFDQKMQLWWARVTSLSLSLSLSLSQNKKLPNPKPKKKKKLKLILNGLRDFIDL